MILFTESSLGPNKAAFQYLVPFHRNFNEISLKYPHVILPTV